MHEALPWLVGALCMRGWVGGIAGWCAQLVIRPVAPVLGQVLSMQDRMAWARGMGSKLCGLTAGGVLCVACFYPGSSYIFHTPGGTAVEGVPTAAVHATPAGLC